MSNAETFLVSVAHISKTYLIIIQILFLQLKIHF